MQKKMNGYIRRKLRTSNAVKNRNNNSRHILKINRSNKNFYAMIVDLNGNVVFSVSTVKITDKHSGVEKAKIIGEIFTKGCLDRKIENVAFDKGPYKYSGRVKTFAESCRNSGLNF